MTKNQIKKTVCIQGLGHVGIAMAAAVAGARNTQDCAIYDVVGVDVETPDGCRKVAAVNLGECRLSAKGNPTRKTKGVRVTVYEQQGAWRYCIQKTKKKEEDVIHSHNEFTTEDQAKIGAFDWLDTNHTAK